jgi:uroporphyrinogen-III synthase
MFHSNAGATAVPALVAHELALTPQPPAPLARGVPSSSAGEGEPERQGASATERRTLERNSYDTYDAPPIQDHLLAGQRIALTWSVEHGQILTSYLEAAGALVTPLFASAIASVGDTSALDAALSRLSRYDWVVLTSLAGVDALAGGLAALGLGADACRHIYTAMLLPVTARAWELAALPPHLVPSAVLADDIEMGLRDIAQKRILLLRAEQTHDTLAALLCQRGAEVDEVSAYRVVAHPVDGQSLHRACGPEGVGVVICTSAVAAAGLLAGFAALEQVPAKALRTTPIIALDEASAVPLRHAGLTPIVAVPSTAPGNNTTNSLQRLISAVLSATSAGDR